MARGTTGAAQQENLTNTQAATSFNNAQSAYGSASTGYNNILSNPGYTPAQINSQTVAAQTPYSVQSAQVQGELARRAATSGNTAGMAAGEDAAARQAASGQSQAALGVQVGAAKDAQQQTQEALSGLSGLYGDSLKGATSLYGTSAELAKLRGQPGGGISLGKLGSFGFS